MDNKKNGAIFARHGDVIFKPATIPTKECKNVKQGTKENPVIAAYGEVTGHSHKMFGDVTLFQFDDKMYAKVTSETRMWHDEHKDWETPTGVKVLTILPPGEYEIDIQQQIDDSGNWQKMID